MRGPLDSHKKNHFNGKLRHDKKMQLGLRGAPKNKLQTKAYPSQPEPANAVLERKDAVTF
jgi:hypothetical protein